jgi:phosphoenolpyruvate carboxykinase (ATP)
MTGAPDFDDISPTENTRAAYPLTALSGTAPSRTGGTPRSVILLTADAFGVLPPIARLSPEQALYYFISGYTAKLAGTERGVTEPQATFSACFGAPFMSRHPMVYGELLEAAPVGERRGLLAGQHRLDRRRLRRRQAHADRGDAPAGRMRRCRAS